MTDADKGTSHLEPTPTWIEGAKTKEEYRRYITELRKYKIGRAVMSQDRQQLAQIISVPREESNSGGERHAIVLFSDGVMSMIARREETEAAPKPLRESIADFNEELTAPDDVITTFKITTPEQFRTSLNTSGGLRIIASTDLSSESSQKVMDFWNGIIKPDLAKKIPLAREQNEAEVRERSYKNMKTVANDLKGMFEKPMPSTTPPISQPNPMDPTT